MIATRLQICLATMLAILRTASAFADEGRPVIASDVAGKKVCWNTGQWDMYGADGQFTNNYGHHSRWSVPEPRISSAGASTGRSRFCRTDASIYVIIVMATETIGEPRATDPWLTGGTPKLAARSIPREPHGWQARKLAARAAKSSRAAGPSTLIPGARCGMNGVS